MIDTSSVELDAIIECETPIRLGHAYGTGEKRTRKGPCPWCGGTDRFAVFVNADPQHFYCGIHAGGSGCGRHGDAITFMQQWYTIPLAEACFRLGIDPGVYHTCQTRPVEQDIEPPDLWQKQAAAFCLECRDILQSDRYWKARVWLREERGLTEETLHRACLGYNPTSQFVEPEVWGLPAEKKVWLPRGFVLPWQQDRANLIKIAIRRLDVDIARDISEGRENPPKYVTVRGSNQRRLYGAYTLQPGELALMVESEFDQLLVRQAMSTLPCVATGSAGNGRGQWSIEQLMQASIVLQSFDVDEAGKSGAAWWTRQGLSMVRWAPWAHDPTDMYRAGMSLEAWLDTGIEVAKAVLDSQAELLRGQHGNSALPIQDCEEKPRAQPSTDACTICGESSWVLTEQGQGYCKACWRALGNTPAEGTACCMCGDFSDMVDEAFYEATEEEKPYCMACWDKRASVQEVPAQPEPMTQERIDALATEFSQGMQLSLVKPRCPNDWAHIVRISRSGDRWICCECFWKSDPIRS